jgi:hypothetical protein
MKNKHYAWKQLTLFDSNMQLCNGKSDCWREPTTRIKSLQTGKIGVYCDKCTEDRVGHGSWEILGPVNGVVAAETAV